MQSVITMCYSCEKCFYGKWPIFLRHYHPCIHDCRDLNIITTQAFGKIHCAWQCWLASEICDWSYLGKGLSENVTRRKNKLKKALYENGNAASEDQRKAYEVLFGSEEFKARKVCLVWHWWEYPLAGKHGHPKNFPSCCSAFFSTWRSASMRTTWKSGMQF